MSNDLTVSNFARRCDRLSIFGFCLIIYMLPISGALMEWGFFFIFAPFLAKRTHWFFTSNDKNTFNSSDQRFFTLLGNFIKSFKPVPNVLQKPIIAFVIAVILSVIFSYYPVLSVKGLFYDVLQGVFIYFIALEAINTEKRLKTVLFFLTVIMGIISSNAIVQIVSGEGFIHHIAYGEGRVTSTFKHANDFAGWLVFMIPIAAASSLIHINRKQDGGTILINHPITKLIYTIILVLLLVSLGYTFSRAAWLGLIASFILLSLFSKRNIIHYAVLVISFILIFYQPMQNVRNVSFVSDKVVELKEEESIIEEKVEKKSFITKFSGMGRKTFWGEAINVFKQRPITGVGLKTYREVALDLDEEFSGYHVHNCYLQMLAEIGVLGLLSFCWIIISIFRYTIRNLNRNKENVYFLLTLGFLVGIFGYLFQATFDTNFYSSKLSTLFWIGLGLLTAIQQNFLLKKTTNG